MLKIHSLHNIVEVVVQLKHSHHRLDLADSEISGITWKKQLRIHRPLKFDIYDLTWSWLDSMVQIR